MLEINSKSKAKCLTKVIKDRHKCTKAEIIFYRASKDKDKGIVLEGGPKSHQTNPPQLWTEFGQEDWDNQVKNFENVMIAYKIFLDLSINVEGRSYTFRQNFQVDPKDKFEAALR